MKRVCVKLHFSDVLELSRIGTNLMNIDASHVMNYLSVYCTRGIASVGMLTSLSTRILAKVYWEHGL